VQKHFFKKIRVSQITQLNKEVVFSKSGTGVKKNKKKKKKMKETTTRNRKEDN